MQIQVIGKHIKVPVRMREHIEEKLDKLAKYRDLLSAKVVLKIEKYLYIAEITMLGSELRFYGEGRSEEHFFAAFDAAELKVAAQLKKRKEKIKNHHNVLARREIAEMVLAGAEELGGSETSVEEPARVIPEKSFTVKAMSVQDAQKKLSTTDRQFFVFRSAETKSVNVIYRRADGNFGLIESES